MDIEPSTPILTSPREENDVDGPGLFSAPQNPHANMERPETHSEAESGSVSEKSSTGHIQDEESSSNSSASAKTSKALDAPATEPHSVAKQPNGPSAMGPPPPPKPDFRATPTSAQPSQLTEPNANQDPPTKSKGQGGRKPTTSAIPEPKETIKTARRKRSHGEIAEPRKTDDDKSDEEFNEPANPIGEFDWEDLESRYHQRMGQLRDQEQELYHSFEGLIEYFSIWSQRGHEHEVDRGCKRLKTQMTLVQHHEQELESKRQHYVKVVEAFKTVAQKSNDAENAALVGSMLARKLDSANHIAKQTIAHATIVKAYDWDDVHPARCVIL